jgi:hypothetical protein
LVVIFLALGYLVLKGPFSGLAISAGLLLTLVHVLTVTRASLRRREAFSRERAAGYTTLYGARYRDLWQLDDRTGEVLREPTNHAKSAQLG